VLTVVSGVLSAGLYSSFLFTGAVGTRLDPVNSYISELGAVGQPGSGLYRASDVGAGLALMLLAVGLYRLSPAGARRTGGAIALLVAGVSSVCDGWYPMRCAPSQDAACLARANAAGLIGQLHRPHTLSSTVGVLAACVAMLLLSGSLRWGAAVASLVGSFAAMEIPLHHGTHWVGLVERAYVLVISGWLVAVAVAHGWPAHEESVPGTAGPPDDAQTTRARPPAARPAGVRAYR